MSDAQAEAEWSERICATCGLAVTMQSPPLPGGEFYCSDMCFVAAL